MSDKVKSIKELTKSLMEGSSKLAKQAEAGFKSQWMGVNDRGEAEWGSTPGIYYGTVGLPALADLAKEGTAPEWAREADEKAGKIRKAVERKMQIDEPKGFSEHLARAAGEMVAQVPVPGAMMNKLRTAKLAVNEAPSLKRKIALAPLEYFSPIVEVGKAKPTAINYGVGTAFGGGLGYGLEKLSENADKQEALRALISKYGPGSGTEEHNISKYSKGGDVEADDDRIPDMPPNPTEADQAEFMRKLKRYQDKDYWKRRGKNSADEDNTPRMLEANKYYPMPTEMPERLKRYSIPEYSEEEMPLKKYLRYYEKGGIATKLKGGKSAFHSAVDNAIATLKQGKGTPEQMMSIIEKTPGVKKEELKIRKIKEALQGKTSVTKEELADIAKKRPAPAPNIIRLKAEPTVEDFLANIQKASALHDVSIDNIKTKLGVDFEVRRHSNGKPFLSVKPNEMPDRSGFTSSELMERAQNRRDYGQITQSEFEDLHKDLLKFTRGIADMKQVYSKYAGDTGQISNLALKGGENYEEVLLQMPTRYDQLRAFAKQRGISDITEAENAYVAEYGHALQRDFPGGHWGDIATNVAAHFRKQSFIDKDGKKVLYVEEVQSDPHQKARDVRNTEIKKRVENEKDKIKRQERKRLDADPDYLPEGYAFKITPLEDLPSGATMPSIDIINTNTGALIGGMPFPGTPESLQAAKEGVKLYHSSAIVRNIELPDARKKEIAKEVADDFGYATPEKQAIAKELDDKIERIRNEGLSDEELAEYFTPGKIVKSYGGVDKVLEFNPGIKENSDQWLDLYNENLEKARREFPDKNDEYHHTRAVQRMYAHEAWSVKVIEVDPQTGEPKRGAQPRSHHTEPSTEILADLRRQQADLGGVIPDLPWKKTYDELALKQIIDDAVNEGYDRVALSPGLEQVKRYTDSLRSEVQQVSWTQGNIEGSKAIEFESKSGVPNIIIDKNGVVIAGPSDWKGEPLKNVVGEDVANKVFAEDYGTVSGEGLTVGAKGFTEFYDKRLPNFLKEYLRKEFATDTGRTEFEYGSGKKRSRRDIHSDLRLNDVPAEYDDLAMELFDEAHDRRVREIAAAYNIDLNDPAVQSDINLGNGLFEDAFDFAQDEAYAQLARHIFENQPDIKPTINAFSFDVTPQMSEKVKGQGQRLFAAAPIAALPLMEDDSEARQVSPNYTIAPSAKTPMLNPQEEQQFQSDVRGTDWFTKFKEKFGEEPNLEDKDYNYRAAWKSGARPQAIEQDDIPHWPSVTTTGESLKARSHPSGWMEDYMQLTGRDPSEGGDLTPEQVDAMNKSLMYRYGEGYEKGGIAKKIKELRAKIANESGEYNAKRLDRAADEVKNLGQTFSSDALRRAFMGDNTTGLIVADPRKYETFAARLPREGYDENELNIHLHGASPQYRIGDRLVNYNEYIRYLQSIAQTTGFSDVPYLNLNKRDKDALLYISGHEGRHRQRALANLGDNKSLVRIEPRAAIREPIKRNTKEQGIEGLKAAIQNKPVLSQDDDLIFLPDVFAKGGLAQYGKRSK